MSKPIQNILQFVLEKAEAEPLSRRAQLYRHLALFVSEEQAAARLTALAQELEGIERQTRQLTLDLQTRKSEKSSN